MRTTLVSFKLALALSLSLAAPLQAKLLTAKIANISTSAGSLQQVQVSLDWPEGAASGSLKIRAAKLDFPALSYKARNIEWQCPLVRLSADGWACAGNLRANGSRPQRLALEYSPGRTNIALGIGSSRLAYSRSTSRAGISDIQIEKVPVQWLQAFLSGLWEQGKWSGGTLSGNVQLADHAPAPMQVKADLRLTGVSVETPDGLLAAAALKGRLKIDYRDENGVQNVDSRFTAAGGELLFDSLYVKFPATPVEVHIVARRRPGAPWQLPIVQWRDNGVLKVDAAVALDAAASVRDVDLTLGFGNLALARDRYLTGFLSPAGFSELQLSGKLAARIRMGAGELTGLHAELQQVNAIDSGARFTFAGIDGSLDWTRAAPPVASRIGWNAGALFGIGLGAADFNLSSSNGQLRLQKPVAIDALEGKLVLDHLRWTAPENATGATVDFGVSMQSMDLASLSQRLGWPAFTGSVSGKIPSARLARDVLTMDGGLQMNLFGGSIELQKLTMERPFGVAPTLSADVQIQDIDLEPMTRVFGFGQITGRLDGRISALRLVDWSPVAFDARLETDRAWKGRRRISQRAVNDISSVGGSGLVGGLQTQVLKFFDDFGYERIGIGCKLKDNVCAMEGISSAGEGYIIVAGAGLPRIQVVGFRRRVDWPTLVSRLRAATEGQAPIIK